MYGACFVYFVNETGLIKFAAFVILGGKMFSFIQNFITSSLLDLLNLRCVW